MIRWLARLFKPSFVAESASFNRVSPTDAAGRILFRAAELVQERGHCKFKLADKLGRICTAQAMVSAALELGCWDYYSPAEDRFEAYVGQGVCHWNNDGAVDAEKVVRTLREAAFSA